MTEYFYSLMLVALLVSVLSFISYKEGEGASRFALGVIMTAAVLLPLLKIIPSVDFDRIIEEIKQEASGVPIYSERCEEAIEEGIARAVCEEFSLSDGSAAVSLSGFDFENMRAEKIKLTLSGRAVFADLEKIEKFVLGLGLGDCEVSVEL